MIDLTLNELQRKQRAFQDAFMEAQLFLEEEKPLPEIKEGELWKKILANLNYYIDYSLEYNDNIYLFKDKTSDIIHRIFPGLRTNLRDPKLNLNFDFSFGTNVYSRYSRHTGYESNFDFNLNRSLGYYNFMFHNSFETTKLAPVRFGVTQEEFPRYLNDFFHLRLSRAFNRLNFNLGYWQSYWDYESEYGSRNDNIQYNFYLGGDFRIAPKTFFLTETQWGFTRYRNRAYSNRDSDSHEFNFGLKGLLTHKLTGIVKLGYRYQDYKTFSDYKDAVLSGALDYQFSKLTQFNFNFERTTHESTYREQDYYINHEFSLSMVHRWAFNPRIYTKLNFDFSYQDFPKRFGISRHDQLWGESFGLGYKMHRWFTFEFSYAHKERESNVDYDYTNNIFIFRTYVLF
ncbi:MAG: outer membrane beta-barrel protein [Candidatus Omnitrophica bacterium]|nr:outer membrane beta-barrel protein [Candidatus Omnitrophota bacterium]